MIIWSVIIQYPKNPVSVFFNNKETAYQQAAVLMQKFIDNDIWNGGKDHFLPEYQKINDLVKLNKYFEAYETWKNTKPNPNIVVEETRVECKAEFPIIYHSEKYRGLKK